MLSVTELNSKLSGIKARLDSGAPLTLTDKRFIEQYYYYVIGVQFKKTNCGDCYKDAFTAMYLRFKKTQTYMQTESGYILKRGVVLATPGVDNVLSGRDVPAELALQHLAKFPSKIKFFEVYPDDWQAQAKAIADGKPINKAVAKLGAGPAEDKSESTDPPYTQEEYDKFISLISEDLRGGVLKKDIKDKYREYVIGDKQIAVRNLPGYIKEAQALIDEQK